MKIKDVYYENKYRLFVKYCEQQDITEVEDLRHFNFYQLYQVQGIGDKKVQEIFEKYKGYEKEKTRKITPKLGFSDELTRMNEDFINSPITVLELFGVKPKIIEKLIELECHYVKDLQKNIFDMKLSASYFKRIQSALQKVSSNYYEILDYVVKLVKNDNYAHLFEARVNGDTLEAIGNNEHFTRERARQILKKFTHEMDLFLRILYHHRSVKNTREVIPLEKVMELIQGLDFEREVMYAINNMNGAVYLEFCQKIVITNLNKKEYYRMLELTAKEYRATYRGDKDYKRFLKNLLAKQDCSLSPEDFFMYTDSKGFKLVHGYLLKKMRPHLVASIEIIKDSFKQGIKVYDDKQLELLKTLVQKKYPEVVFPSNDRTLSTRLADELILCKRGTYIHRAHVEAKIEIIEDVCDYIDQSDKQRILYSELFEVFQDRLIKETTITNRDYLHGLLLHYFPKRYHYERDYVGKCAKSNETTAEHLSDFLRTLDRAANITEVQDAIKGISKAMIYNIITKSDEVIHWENNYFISTDRFKITEADVENLKKIVDESLAEHDKYTNEVLVFEEVSKLMPEFIAKNNIKRPVNLFYILQYVCRNDYFYRKPHILSDPDCGLDCVMRDKVAKHLNLDPYFNYHEFFEFGKKLRWNEQTIYALHRNIMKDYYHLDEDVSILKSKIVLNEDDFKIIRKGIEKQLKREPYIALINGINFTNFPDIGVKWTTHLLEDIITEYDLGYECVNFQRKDRRIQKSVLVRKKDFVRTLEDFVILLFADKLKQGIPIAAVNDYLVKNFIVFESAKFNITDATKLTVKDDILFLNE